MHMMVETPEKWIKDMSEAGASQYTFHLESTDKPLECIRLIKETGMKVCNIK
jgi:ribulose-phosphate 3-epimerase